MKNVFALLLITVTIASCGDKAEKQTSAGSADSARAVIDTNDYIPITYMLNQDMRNVESYAGGILRKVKKGNIRDSNYVQYRDFQSIAGQFLVKELDSTYFRDHFTETSLMDETSRLLNFIYTTKDSTSPLRKVIVYVSPTLTSDKVDRIYMEITETKDNVRTDKRMTWKTGKYFYIFSTRQPLSGDSTTTMMERVIWDPEHFGDQ